jgi:hypothetical protein
LGDVFRIERDQGALRAYRNGAELAEIDAPGTGPLYCDTWLASLGAAISGAVISTAGEDAVPVTWVNHVGTSETLAIAYSWDTTTIRDGSHEFGARVVDVAGNDAESSAVVLSVDNTLPVCSLTTPRPKAVVSGGVEVSATASDANFATLAFFADDSLISQHDGRSTATTTWDTTMVENGAHVLRAQAYDFANNASLPCQITVTVSN